MLAERPTARVLFVAAGALLAIMVVVEDEREARRVCTVAPPPVVEIAPPPIDIDCPEAALATLRVDQPLALFCRHTDRGVFAVAQYMTTERWERMALVDATGELVFPLVDQPTPGNVDMTDVTIGGPDKTIGYANGSSLRVVFDRDVLMLDYSRE